MDSADRGTAESDAFRTSMMLRAVENGAGARLRTSPNPWVGAVLIDRYGALYDGATHPPGGAHAEREALDAAGDAARGATLFTTLEPCNHHGRTSPCTQAIIEAGVERVIISILDPDPLVRGEGMAALIAAGVDVTLGVEADVVTKQLSAYLTHRTTGRPRVIVKLAMTLDGFIAAPDGSSKWITGPDARRDVHRLRAESDVIVVGSGTVAADDPSLTVRDYQPLDGTDLDGSLDPWRIVLGARAPELEQGARSAPYEAWEGSIEDLLDDLGSRNMLQLLVEGGGQTAGAFHLAGLVDEYWIYMAPAIMGGNAGTSLFVGEGAKTMAAIQRGTFVGVTQLGDDVRLVYLPG
ncbi:MAG: bifunctional diaminohydroxyphosphoribosylaminopyrimidine deaminase/5-amino-6-(5-phosphoribosylamino)uracil reductase RibD [Acidimicrobiia bacterium]|nr:bifunctional diaminohydroxyphosphoribosylaminopyrimidine deaminase/5-amino-6-(5-phosphoribosylamino)uracil reductase RibD [Acidimicrobiia bacterium]